MIARTPETWKTMAAAEQRQIRQPRTFDASHETSAAAGCQSLAAADVRPPATEFGFGPHLVFDGRGCPPGSLQDLERLDSPLDRLPDRIRMTKIMLGDRHALTRSLGLGATS